MSSALRISQAPHRKSHTGGRPNLPLTTASPIALEILRLVRQCGMTEAEICKAGEIGKNQITRLRSGAVKIPSRRVLGRLLAVLVKSHEAREAIRQRAKIARDAARIPPRRRFHVPPEHQRDWDTLKAHNYTNAEAAHVLGIPYGATQ